MGRTLLGSLGQAAAAFTNRAPIALAPTAGRAGLVSSIVRPAGQEAQMRAMGSVGTLFAIVERITTAYSQVEWHLYRSAKSGRVEDRVEVTSHAALDLWTQPNSFMTGPQWREATQQHEELTGEQWWVIARHERSSIPLELWFARPDRMTPNPDRDTFLSDYTYSSPSGEQVPLGVDDVIMLRRPNPLDPYRGWGPVQTLLADLDSSRASAEWNANFFRNSAQPGGIVEVDKRLSDDEFNEFRDRWNEQHRGVSNAHRVAVLENGLKWQDRAFTQRDMQFTELRDLNREIIREAFGFPKPMLGTVDDANRANMEAAEDIFAKWLVRTRLRRTRQALNTRLLPLYGAMGNGLEFDFADPVTGDVEMESKQLTAQANAAAALVNVGFDPAGTLSAVGLPDIPFTRPPATAPQAATAPTALLDRPRAALPAAPTAWDRAVAHLLNAQDANPLDQVRADQEDALSQLLDRWTPIEAAWVSDLGDQIHTAINDDNAAALALLTVDSDRAAGVLREALGGMAQRAAGRMVDEAAAQGVTVDVPELDQSLTNRLDAGALRAAFGSELVEFAAATAGLLGSGLAAAAGREALRLFTPGADGSAVADQVKGFLRGLSNRLKLDQLGGALHRATNTGRVAVLEAAPTATYTASEVNDANRCGPCAEIDGTEFSGLDAVRAAYGAGPYRLCQGGIRCRGTVVARWV
ncbi:phage portal protein [Streptomyces sp. NPDC005574]|uniref:phage portal protein n=1 Tax=Streptomyces sp. NPDC005574 TaxID=3156891 RepID=UPI0033B2C296